MTATGKPPLLKTPLLNGPSLEVERRRGAAELAEKAASDMLGERPS